MRNLIKSFGFCAALALAASFASPASAQVGFSIHIGTPPQPVPEYVALAPFEGAIWVPGYYTIEYGHYRWVRGSWQRPPFEGARWIAPRYDGDRFIEGRWDRDHDHMRFRGDEGFHDRDFHGFRDRDGRDDRHADRDRDRGDRDNGDFHGRR